jgi:hypothetical protein
MADADLPDLLQSLRVASKRYEELSDKANDVLAEVEAQLRESKVGVEYWIGSQPLEVSDGVARILGFTRVEGEWSLATRRHTYASGKPGGAIPNSTVSLRRSSRDARLRAMTLLPDLVAGITATVNAKTESVATSLERLAKRAR